MSVVDELDAIAAGFTALSLASSGSHTGRHTLNMVWERSWLDVSETVKWQAHVTGSDGDPGTALHPIILWRERSGPVTVRINRISCNEVQPLHDSILEVMQELVSRCDALELNAPWLIISPVVEMFNRVKHLIFISDDVREIRNLLCFLSSPMADGQPNMPLLSKIHIICRGGCELDLLVYRFTHRVEVLALKRKLIALTYTSPAGLWPPSPDIAAAKGDLYNSGVNLHFEALENDMQVE
ncbi:uncharacterized protein SCHCODRAFT_02749068 [Schizophyllum commune H4-8]|nr:uncharacterized protein SCHCODRAFT_02749068 [Schizophyllum commune H4-8]KAI5890910.1 hypothetical protein SCHCODRAFT_02749068 [Schizophyllum commune H4-8]